MSMAASRPALVVPEDVAEAGPGADVGISPATAVQIEVGEKIASCMAEYFKSRCLLEELEQVLNGRVKSPLPRSCALVAPADEDAEETDGGAFSNHDDWEMLHEAWEDSHPQQQHPPDCNELHSSAGCPAPTAYGGGCRRTQPATPRSPRVSLDAPPAFLRRHSSDPASQVLPHLQHCGSQQGGSAAQHSTGQLCSGSSTVSQQLMEEVLAVPQAWGVVSSPHVGVVCTSGSQQGAYRRDSDCGQQQQQHAVFMRGSTCSVPPAIHPRHEDMDSGTVALRRSLEAHHCCSNEGSRISSRKPSSDGVWTDHSSGTAALQTLSLSTGACWHGQHLPPVSESLPILPRAALRGSRGQRRSSMTMASSPPMLPPGLPLPLPPQRNAPASESSSSSSSAQALAPTSYRAGLPVAGFPTDAPGGDCHKTERCEPQRGTATPAAAAAAAPQPSSPPQQPLCSSRSTASAFHSLGPAASRQPAAAAAALSQWQVQLDDVALARQPASPRPAAAWRGAAVRRHSYPCPCPAPAGPSSAGQAGRRAVPAGVSSSAPVPATVTAILLPSPPSCGASRDPSPGTGRSHMPGLQPSGAVLGAIGLRSRRRTSDAAGFAMATACGFASHQVQNHLHDLLHSVAASQVPKSMAHGGPNHRCGGAPSAPVAPSDSHTSHALLPLIPHGNGPCSASNDGRPPLPAPVLPPRGPPGHRVRRHSALDGLVL